MKQLLIIFLLIFFSITGFSQQDKIMLNEQSLTDSLFEEKIIGVVADMRLNNPSFLNKKFIPGTIQLINGSLIKNKLLNYDCHTDELIWIRQSPYQIVVVSKSTVLKFSLSSETESAIITFKKLKARSPVSGDSADLYLQVLKEGLVSLFVQRRKQETDNKYKNYNTYFIQNTNGEISRFKCSRKNLFDLFEKIKKELKPLINKEHLRMKQESNIIRAIEIINKYLISRK